MATKIEVHHFGRKVRLFNPVFNIGTQQDLVTHLGVKPNTLAVWISEDRVPETALEQLARLLVARHPCRLTFGEAYAAWRGPYSEFEAVIFRRKLVELLSVLRNVEPDLKVARLQVGSGFSMVVDCIDLDENVETIPLRDRYRFEIAARVGHRLAILCADFGGWRLLAPGRLHDGVIDEDPALFPGDETSPLSFAGRGLHHFVFIEHAPALEPMLPRAGGVPPLDSAQLDQFARQLALPCWAGTWRWCEAIYNVD